MNSEALIHFDNIIAEIEKKEYSEAQNKLVTIISDKTIPEESISYAYYLLGYINTCWDNKNGDRSYARRMLINCMESNFPFPEAYLVFADKEDDKNVVCNYLKIGLKKFERNISIYHRLLRYCKKGDALEYINDIEKENLVDVDLFNQAIDVLISISYWEKVEVFLNKLLSDKSIEFSDYNLLYYKLLYSYSLVIQNKEIEEAKNNFSEIIENDLPNKLNFSPHMGYIWCSLKMNLYADAIKYFDKIPISNSLEDFYEGPWCTVSIDFSTIYKQVFAELQAVLLGDKIRILKLSALEAYYLYIPSETYFICRYTKKHLNILKRYLKTDATNLDIASAVYNMQIHFGLFVDAYMTYMEMLCEFLNPSDKYIDGLDFLDKISADDNEKIYQDALKKLKTYNFNYERFIPSIFDPIVGYVFKSEINQKYAKIRSLSDMLKNKYLEKSKKLFEVAFSYGESNETLYKAERFYLHMLQDKKDNDAVLNNLGVIYEHKNELKKAKDYYERAYRLNNKDLYSRNLKRVGLAIIENDKAIESLEKENAWFLGRLYMVYTAANSLGEVLCTYRERPSLLSVSPNKANEIFDNMCKRGYLKKISGEDTQSSNKYIINPQVKEYLWREKERIENNKFYEGILESVNIDEIEKIGYTELRDLIGHIGNPDLRDILNRDIKECAISLLAKQYKSCIVICGSIIEAVLVDRIEDRGISKYDIGMLLKYKTKTKSIKEMDLNELIELAKVENIVDIERYHLSNFVRFYRNIIHPSCEVRKKYEVDDEKAKLMWNVLKEIVKGLLS